MLTFMAYPYNMCMNCFLKKKKKKKKKLHELYWIITCICLYYIGDWMSDL